MSMMKEVSVTFILWSNGEVTTTGWFIVGCSPVKTWTETIKVEVPKD